MTFGQRKIVDNPWWAFWLEDDVYGESCRQDYKDKVEAAWANLLRKSCLQVVPDLYNCMLGLWESVVIYCEGDHCSEKEEDGTLTNNIGYWLDSEGITLCFDNYNRDCDIESNLLHEMVHGCGGSELDSEIMENWCAPCPTRPVGNDWDKFCYETTKYIDDGMTISREGGGSPKRRSSIPVLQDPDDPEAPILNGRMGKYFILDLDTGRMWTIENGRRGKYLTKSANFIPPLDKLDCDDIQPPDEGGGGW